MKIEPEILKYLNGELFKNTLTVKLRKLKHENISRESAITEMITKKDVIHIGCSDHIQIINEKIRINKWLHKLISENAKSCIGIDIDKESVDYIKQELGYKNVLHGDVLTDNFDEIKEKSWDYAVFGEILEHLDNPVNFLKVFKKRFGGQIGKFIITVPNIYNKQQFRNMKNYKEVINSDHRFWFTPYTITKLLFAAGYYPKEISYANVQKLKFHELILRKIKRFAGLEVRYPFYYFNTIIISGDFNTSHIE